MLVVDGKGSIKVLFLGLGLKRLQKGQYCCLLHLNWNIMLNCLGLHQLQLELLEGVVEESLKLTLQWDFVRL